MKKRGRPRKQNPLDEYIELRVTESEKQAFRDAAERAGIPMATWIRERLRKIATRELESAELEVAFLRWGCMIKPEYPKRADFSQIARSVVGHANGSVLTPPSPLPLTLKKSGQAKRKNKQKK